MEVRVGRGLVVGVIVVSNVCLGLFRNKNNENNPIK